MNKKYIGTVDGNVGVLDVNNMFKIEVFEGDWIEFWNDVYKKGEYGCSDELVFYVGDDEKEVKEKLKEYLVNEIMNS